MFRLIVRLTLPILIVCAMLTALAPLVAPRPVAVSPQWSAFGFAACALPCWAGITVGETPAVAVLPLVQANIPTLTDYNSTAQQINVWSGRGSIRTEVRLHYAPGYVELMTFSLYAPPDHLVDVLGMPDCVISIMPGPFGTDYMLMWIGDEVVTAGMFGELENLFSPKNALHALVIDQHWGQMTCEQYGAIPFRGIASWWRYQQWITAAGG